MPSVLITGANRGLVACRRCANSGLHATMPTSQGDQEASVYRALGRYPKAIGGGKLQMP
jgi:hypothetical protein